MERILAIESDPKRANLLTSLVRSHVNADLEIVGTVAAAIESLSENTPDLILAPALLSPQDSYELMDHVKRLQAPWVQTLTVPALDMLTDRQPEMKVRTSFFRRRPVELGLQYDPGMVADSNQGWPGARADSSRRNGSGPGECRLSHEPDGRDDRSRHPDGARADHEETRVV